MTTKQTITALKFKLNEAISMAEDLTDSDMQQSYTLSDGTHITYLTALVRSHIQRGWQPRTDIKIESHKVTEALIIDGDMFIHLDSTSIQIRNVTFPPKPLSTQVN